MPEKSNPQQSKPQWADLNVYVDLLTISPYSVTQCLQPNTTCKNCRWSNDVNCMHGHRITKNVVITFTFMCFQQFHKIFKLKI